MNRTRLPGFVPVRRIASLIAEKMPCSPSTPRLFKYLTATSSGICLDITFSLYGCELLLQEDDDSELRLELDRLVVLVLSELDELELCELSELLLSELTEVVDSLEGLEQELDEDDTLAAVELLLELCEELELLLCEELELELLDELELLL